MGGGRKSTAPNRARRSEIMPNQRVSVCPVYAPAPNSPAFGTEEGERTMELRYRETEDVLNEVAGVFASRDDSTLVKEGGRAIVEMKAAADARHREMMRSIKELTRKVEHVQSKHIEREARMMDGTAKHQLIDEKDKIVDSISAMQQEIESVQAEIDVEQRRALAIAAREQQHANQEAVEVARLRHSISLYANISSLRWDYSSPRVKGWVTSASGRGMRAFEMEQGAQTEFTQCNHLWELMDSVA